MKLGFLNNKSWDEITREERVFCAELYFQMRNDLKPFLKLLHIPESKEFDIGFEVCFYRDILKHYQDEVDRDIPSIRRTELPPKRTFDLALLADDEIVLIEAKANQDFDKKQIGYFEKDQKFIETLFKLIRQPQPKVRLWAICSTKSNKLVKEPFKGQISWINIAEAYPVARRIFERANEVHE